MLYYLNKLESLKTLNKKIPTGGQYMSLGCWKDSIPRAMEELEHRMKYLGWHKFQHYYKSRENAIQKCFTAALYLKMDLFGVQDGGQCFGTNSSSESYKINGKSTDCLADGKGGPMANHVYKISIGIFI